MVLKPLLLAPYIKKYIFKISFVDVVTGVLTVKMLKYFECL